MLRVRIVLMASWVRESAEAMRTLRQNGWKNENRVILHAWRAGQRGGRRGCHNRGNLGCLGSRSRIFGVVSLVYIRGSGVFGVGHFSDGESMTPKTPDPDAGACHASGKWSLDPR